jgi:malonate transporter and related proteins
MSTVLNSVLPVFAIIALGSVLKRTGLIDDAFMGKSDRLIYYIFFPALLFWKIGKPATAAAVDWYLILAVICALFTVFVASLIFVKAAGYSDFEVGSFTQACYRFNTYVGMAIVLAALKDDGVRQFGVLIGFVIPFLNVLAVSSMTYFSGKGYSWRANIGLLVRSVLSNPLIIACVAGIGYSYLGIPLPDFLGNTFALMALLSLPLALISIGGTLRVSGMAGHARASLIAAAFKFVLLPLVGYAFLKTFGVSDAAFKVAMIYFVLPTSPAGYILSAQLNSDVELATSAIVVSTLVSVVPLSIVLLMLAP